MRSSRLLLVFAALVGVSQACVKDDAQPGGLDVDAGSIDASVSDSGGPANDGTVPEAAAPDGGADSSAPGPVTVIVFDKAHAPVAGVKVAFVEPSGTASIEITDDKGKAAHVLSAGGTVIAADATDTGMRRLTTIFSVEPSDTLEMLGGAGAEPLTPLPFATFNFAQNAQLFAGASTSEIALCGQTASIETDGSLAQDIDIPTSCVANGKIDVLGIARNGSGGVIAYAVKQVAVTQGTKSTTAIATADWANAVGNTFAFTGTAPPLAVGASAAFDFFKGGLFFLESRASATVDNTSHAFDAPPTGFADLFQSFSLLTFQDGADGGMQNGFEPVSLLLTQGTVPAQGTKVTAAFTDFLPRIHDVSVTGIATPQIAWQEDAAITGALGGFLTLNGTIDVDGGLDSFEWTVVFPAGSPSVALPSLPAAIADFTPTQELQLTSLGLLASPDLASYKNFRATASAYSSLVNEVTYPVPVKPLTVKVTGLRPALAN